MKDEFGHFGADGIATARQRRHFRLDHGRPQQRNQTGGAPCCRGSSFPSFSPVRWPCRLPPRRNRATPNGARRARRPRTAEALEALARELEALIDDAEKARAADPRFLQDLRDMIAAHVAEAAPREALVHDDFSDGDYTDDPRWEVVSGEFSVEGTLGLRTTIPLSGADTETMRALPRHDHGDEGRAARQGRGASRQEQGHGHRPAERREDLRRPPGRRRRRGDGGHRACRAGACDDRARGRHPQRLRPRSGDDVGHRTQGRAVRDRPVPGQGRGFRLSPLLHGRATIPASRSRASAGAARR